MGKPKSKIFKAVQLIVSLIALFIIVIIALYAKNRIQGKLNVWQVKIPRNEAEFKQVSDDIVAGVVRSATEGGIKSVLGRSEVFFEESDITAPARSIRDDAKNTAQNLLDRIKALPAEEYKIIKQKIYETWFKPN